MFRTLLAPPQEALHERHLVYCLHVISDCRIRVGVFRLLRIKGLYMFGALLAHPQEMLHKRHLVYCVCYFSWLHQVWSIEFIKN
jgi:hypothetical protein